MYFIDIYDLHLTYLDDDTAFIITQSHIIRASETAHTPNSLHPIVQSALQAVRAGMPDTHRAYRERILLSLKH